MISQSWCFLYLAPVILLTAGYPLADSDAQLLGPTLLRRSSALTDSVLGRDPLNPLLDPLTRSLDTLALASVHHGGHGLLGSSHGYTNIMALLKASPRHTVLVRALTVTDLAASLETGGPFTLFAPTNHAFDVVGRDKMLNDVDGLRKVLLRHISRQKLPSLSIPGGVSQVDMANNEKLTIAVLSGRIAVYSAAGAAEVTSTDSYAANGIVHTIDAII